MESPTTSTCEPYRQSGQKRCRKFCARKPAKKERRTRVHAKTAEVGCVLGAGEECSRCGRVGEPEIRTNVNPTPIQHVQKENRRKPRVSAGFVAGAEGLEPSARGFGVDVGGSPEERGWGCVGRFSPQVAKQAVLVWCFRAGVSEKSLWK